MYSTTLNLNVAVTGVGGASGQGIMKALMAARIRDEESRQVAPVLFPVDVNGMSAGIYRGKGGGTVLPKPEVNIGAWLEWALEHDIQVILPGSDYDLLPLAQVRDAWLEEHGIHVLVSNPEMVRIANDKAETIRFLETYGIATPETILAPLPKLHYPVVVKPRSDAASRGVHVCRDVEELMFHFKRTRNALIQEHLSGHEYTCAAYFDRDTGEVYTCIARRTLYAGSTYTAHVAPVPHVAEYVEKVARAFQPMGVLNVQLIDTPDRGPVLLEVNARCSGSTAIRAHFGYNEPQMLIEQYVYGRRLFQPAYRCGMGFRYWDELFLEGAAPEELTGTIGRVDKKGRTSGWL